MKMNSRVRANLQSMRNSIKDSKKRIERQMQLQQDQKTKTTSRGDYENDRKMTLEKDIEKLEKELTREENVHRALEQALTQPLGTLTCLPSYDLPPMKRIERQMQLQQDQKTKTTSRGDYENDRKMTLEKDIEKLEKELTREENVHRALEQVLTQPLGTLTCLPSYDLPPMKRIERQMQLQQDQKTKTTSRGDYENDRKMTLEKDIEKLEKELTREENVHRALEQVLTQPLGTLTCLPSYDLPPMTLELLTEVAVLEEEVIRLEEQVVKYNQDLYQEAIYTSFYKTNIENLSDFHEKSHTKDPKSITTTLSPPQIEWFSNPLADKQQSPDHNIERAKTLTKRPLIDILSTEKYLDFRKVQYKGISGDDDPNKISESTLKCLMFVFTRMSSNSALKLTEMLPSLASACEHPWTMDFKDPYGIFYEFENTDIGPYKYFYEIEATTISKSRMTISSFLAQRLKILLGKLEVVNLTSLTHQEKLAFWINIYNSCMMNAFLEHGIPETRDLFIQLMHEAKLNIGGHLLNAFSIEHFILRLPFHTKHTFAKDFNNDGVTARNLFGLESYEPLATFALSCGSWSSPAVRVYTGSEVKNELEVAKRDYLQAAVGISTTKKLLAIPKLLDWYMFDFANDIESFVEWVCIQLPSEVQKVAINCVERKMSDQSLSNFIRVIPYKFHFRYLLCK